MLIDDFPSLSILSITSSSITGDLMKLLLATLALFLSSSVFAQNSEYVIKHTLTIGDHIYLITDNNVIVAKVYTKKLLSNHFCNSIELGISNSSRVYATPTYKVVRFKNKTSVRICQQFSRLIKTIALGAPQDTPPVITIREDLNGVEIDVEFVGETYTFKNP